VSEGFNTYLAEVSKHFNPRTILPIDAAVKSSVHAFTLLVMRIIRFFPSGTVSE
jgi:hypothetical protein